MADFGRFRTPPPCRPPVRGRLPVSPSNG